MPQPRRGHGIRVGRTRPRFGLRLALFVGLAVLIVGTAGWLLRPRSSPPTADRALEITMAGFQPATLTVPAGRATTVLLTNPDSSFHTDGGGIHQFAIPDLGLDVRVQPKSVLTATIPSAAPGAYPFYCDTCCGGKDNPTMRGTLVVR